MSSSFVAKSIQQELDEFTEALQANLDDFTRRLKSERRASTPPPPPPLNHEDLFSPSSDDCASVGSPAVSVNDGHSFVSLDDAMFTQAKTDINRSQDQTKNKENNNNNNQNLFPAINSNNNDVCASHRKPAVRSYNLPDITFTGSILKSTLAKKRLSLPELITEGLLVNKFLDEFESHIKQTNLNIEDHWYGFLEISFKSVRDQYIDLYVWFKKRLYEGLPWENAKAIMKHQLGFESCNSKKTIEEALVGYEQGARERFDLFYNRFQSYVAASKALSLYPDRVLIHHFISNVRAEAHTFIKNCLHKQLELKARERTLPFSEKEYAIFSLGERDDVNILCRVSSSWEEFNTTIISANMRKLCLISHDTVSQVYPRRVHRAKLQARKGGVTEKTKNLHKSNS